LRRTTFPDRFSSFRLTSQPSIQIVSFPSPTNPADNPDSETELGFREVSPSRIDPQYLGLTFEKETKIN
jgi:hypothetical protein